MKQYVSRGYGIVGIIVEILPIVNYPIVNYHADILILIADRSYDKNEYEIYEERVRRESKHLRAKLIPDQCDSSCSCLADSRMFTSLACHLFA